MISLNVSLSLVIVDFEFYAYRKNDYASRLSYWVRGNFA